MPQKILPFFALILAFYLLQPQTAAAQTNRIYFAGYMGLNIFRDQDFSESSTGARGHIEMDDDVSFAGAIGFRLTPQLRLEGELSYGRWDMAGISFSDGGSFDLGGDLRSWIGMVNLYYDFDVDWKFKPFIGAGIGYGWHTADINDPSGFAADVSDETGAFAYQVGGGLKYRVSPDLAFTGSYRYMDSLGLDLGSYDIDTGDHIFRIGVEYDF